MTTTAERRAVPEAPGVAGGLRAVRLTVLAFLLLDVGGTIIGQAHGSPDLGPLGRVHTAEMLLITVACVAAMWRRLPFAVALTAVIVALVFTAGPSGGELWLLVVTGVTAGARAGRRGLVLVVLAQLGYAVCFGLRAENVHEGWGWVTGLSTLGFCLASLAAGLVARRLLRARDSTRLRVQQLTEEHTQIRALERGRLADELQSVVTGGLATVRDEIETTHLPASDVATLRRGLDRVDTHSRALLTELRVLLDVLRSAGAEEPSVAPAPRVTGPRGWFDLLTARHVRLAGTAFLGLLAVRAALRGLDSPATTAVQVLSLTAWAVVLWRPRVGLACAVVALVAAAALDPQHHWDVLPVALLSLFGSFRCGPRRLGWVVVTMGAYAGLVALTGGPAALGRLNLDGYVALLGIAAGLAAEYFVGARDDSERQLADLADQRNQVESEERSAVARELHDVVAHQLSVTTMLVMATSSINDRARLSTTFDRVSRSTEAAHHELDTLLYAMRGDENEPVRPESLVLPVASARAIARQLSDNGYRPVLQIDPAANGLDTTTQRTLARIMQEAATNILRYTPPGSVCTYALSVQTTGVRLSIVSPLPVGEGACDLSLGWGLRGIRERVDLTHGTFHAGPDAGQWLLVVTLPGSPEQPCPAGASLQWGR